MTDIRRPPACHHDRTLEQRVTRDHGQACPTRTGGTCPGTDGCTPCTAPHCTTCNRNHLDNTHPLTCPDCIGHTRDDLLEVLWLCRHLRNQAARAGRNGRLAAAAPIPGADAMVMLARAGADLDDLIWRPDLDDDHHPDDPVPPLLPLAAWAQQWATWHHHQTPARPTVSGIVGYLTNHLTGMAQAVDGPDWTRFAHDIADLRRRLEGVLHDERDPERGVSCFECGDTLVRKFGRPQACRHRTPADAHVDRIRAGAQAARVFLDDVLPTYPELGPPSYADRKAARRTPTAAELAATRAPCPRCIASTTGQGGILDPSVGQSWECVGCRKLYTPGEYGNAVRRDLLEGGPDGDGWTHIGMAAEAASTMTGYVIAEGTVRKWMDRGRVAAVCRWAAGASWGLRLVFWPDVADQAAAAVERAQAAAAAREQRARQAELLAAAVARGEDVDEAGRRLGIHQNRVRAIVDEWAVAEHASA
jgi:hypothetical protein